ncbi:Uncharacterised protein [Morganella morganii]|nr:hypothetical protein Mm0Y_00835 [Morganella morganii]STZ19635.1 Uncharacterised protein [Morganella morganii]
MSDYPAVPGVLFVAGFGPVTRDPARSKHFFADTVGLPLSESEGVPDYLTADHSLHGVKHFALWPLSHAAVSCFGQDSWPSSHPEPQAWVEFEVRDLAAATEFYSHRATRCWWQTEPSRGDSPSPVCSARKVYLSG